MGIIFNFDHVSSETTLVCSTDSPNDPFMFQPICEALPLQGEGALIDIKAKSSFGASRDAGVVIGGHSGKPQIAGRFFFFKEDRRLEPSFFWWGWMIIMSHRRL